MQQKCLPIIVTVRDIYEVMAVAGLLFVTVCFILSTAILLQCFVRAVFKKEGEAIKHESYSEQQRLPEREGGVQE